MLLVAIIIIFCILFYYDKRNRNLKVYYQQELLRAKLEIQEQTFKTVSQEIHDNIGQILSLAKLNLNRIDAYAAMHDAQKLNDAKALISKSIKDLRNLSRALNADTISNIGLVKAIEIELKLLHNAEAKEVNLKIEGKVERLDAQKELILYRIFQESIHNIIKDTQASFVQVIFIFKKESFELVILDNSAGLADSIENNLGSGTQNMKSRAQLIGATWQRISAPETGTRIHIYLPITN